MGLFSFFKKSKKEVDSTPQEEATLKKGIKSTSNKLQSGLSAIFLGKKSIDNDMIEALEELLITSDIGVIATEEIIERVRKDYTRDTLSDIEKVTDAIYQVIVEILSINETENSSFNIDNSNKPYTLLICGVNGVGKTTSIAKLAYKYKNMGLKIMLACADTFRAGAKEQLIEWANRLNIDYTAGEMGADPSSIAYKAIERCKNDGSYDILIIDTAGRLHNKENLMRELEKVGRVAEKLLGRNIDEKLIVLDGTTGQNALNQAKAFKESMDVSGVILTKLDGTSKGGVSIRIASDLKLPIKYIGVGERMEDLQDFHAETFSKALLNIEK